MIYLLALVPALLYRIRLWLMKGMIYADVRIRL